MNPSDGGEGDAGRREAASSDAAATWNARYAASEDAVLPPARVLERHASRLPATDDESRDALDLACGRAGNGEWLAARGFRVTAWDISERAIEAIGKRPSSGIHRAEVRDVRTAPPEESRFDVIVVVRFLERGLCPAIARALRPGGVLYYQTFTHGLSNTAFLLGPNELLSLFPTLGVLHYREPAPDARGRAEAMLVARRDPT